MALINQVDNLATVVYNGSPINSNTVSTLLLLPPTVVKTVDKILASIGEVLTYTITITNLSHPAITSLPFSDTVATGAQYIAGSFKVNASVVTPTITGATLSTILPTIPSLGVAVIEFKVTVVGGVV